MADENLKEKELTEEEKKASEKFKEIVDKRLKECKFEEKENSYSFEFEGQHFEFKGSPTVFEQTQIQAICASITRFPGAPATVSSEFDIISSGDFGLAYSSKVLTHTAILIIEPRNFDVSKYKEKMYPLGELITFAERRYQDNKKKPSTKDQ